ncbi:MAG: bifunctional DNA primase/polymerase, partial [Paracoccaceae bacterium]
TTNSHTIESWWRRWPDSIPAFEPGAQPIPMLVIDCDRHGGPDGVAVFDALAIDHADDPRDWPTVETPSTGRHVFFANPDGLTNARGALPAGIDVRGSGGYVVAEGATLPDGRCYRVPDGMSGFIDAMESGALPVLPDWLKTILTTKKEVEQLKPVAAIAPSNTDARGKAIADKALAEDIAALASTTGNRNDGVNGLAYRLGRMIAAGWIDRATVESHLENACAANGLWKDDGPRQCRMTIKSGLDNGIQAGPAALADRSAPSVVINLPVTQQPADIIEQEADEPDEESIAPPLDDALTRVPGILGDIVDFIVATARRPNRRIALGAALTICGTLVGRRMATPTAASTHLYVIATYPTGAGKQHTLDAIDRLMTAAQLSRHLGPSQFMSMSALVKHAERSPLSVCAQDEFGAVLAKIGHPKASGHEQAISQVLRSLWGANFATVRTPAYATTDSKEIKCPSLSLFGPSTSGELYEALKGRDVVNGFLNRFLVIDGGDRVSEVDPAQSLRSVPDTIVAKMHALYRLGQPTGNLNGLCKNTAPDPSPLCIPWHSADAQDAYKALVKQCEARMDGDADAEPFFVRVAEIALRCATIRACGRSTVPTLALDDMQWGADLAWQSAERLKSDAERYMVDPLGAAEFERTVMKKISQSPRGEITLRKLHRSMQRHFRNASDMRQATESLARSGLIKMETRTAVGGSTIVVSRI